MKHFARFLIHASLLMIFDVPVCAQQTAEFCTREAEPKAALYKNFLANYKGSGEQQRLANQHGNDYISKYGNCPDDSDRQISAFIQRWLGKYEKAVRRSNLLSQLAANKVNEAFASAKAVLQDYPDDAGLLYDLARSGITAALAGNHVNDADTLAYARQTIQMLQSNKSFNPDQPLSDAARNETVGYLYWGIGTLTKQSAPSEAIDALMNTAKLEGATKRNPLTYAMLADIYEVVYYAPLSDKYKQDCQTEEQSKAQPCTELKAKVEAAVDHFVDALARAVAYSNVPENKSGFDQYRPNWMDSLTTYYKYRHQNSDAGLKEFIEGISAKPMMERMK